MRLSLVIPAHRRPNVTTGGVDSALRHLTSRSQDAELIVVDPAASDADAERLQSLAREAPALRGLRDGGGADGRRATDARRHRRSRRAAVRRAAGRALDPRSSRAPSAERRADGGRVARHAVAGRGGSLANPAQRATRTISLSHEITSR